MAILRLKFRLNTREFARAQLVAPIHQPTLIVDNKRAHIEAGSVGQHVLGQGARVPQD